MSNIQLSYTRAISILCPPAPGSHKDPTPECSPPRHLSPFTTTSPTSPASPLLTNSHSYCLVHTPMHVYHPHFGLNTASHSHHAGALEQAMQSIPSRASGQLYPSSRSLVIGGTLTLPFVLDPLRMYLYYTHLSACSAAHTAGLMAWHNIHN